jgi:hypothetical protein
MICSGSLMAPSCIKVTLRKPLEPNRTIQPAARTALPTNSGSTTSMISTFLNRDWVRAST